MALAISTTWDGRPVVELDLRDGDPLSAIAEARAGGASLIWAYGRAELEEHGFQAAGSYCRLHAEHVPRGEPLPISSSPDLLFDLFDRGYHGLWGHKQVVRERFDALAVRPDLVHVVLDEVGVCRLEPADRLIDSPGVVGDARDPAVYARLVLGACAVLGEGPADIDSWGDAPDVLAAYCGLGFEVIERLEGYELSL